MKSKSQVKKVSLKDKVRISHLGLKAQGSVPWTKDETDTFLSLYLELSNKKTKSSKTIFERIASKLNSNFHKGKKVRTARSVSVHKYNLKNSRYSMRGLKTKYKNHPFFLEAPNVKSLIHNNYSEQIVDMYKVLKTKEEIAKELNLTKKHKISLSTAKSYLTDTLNKFLSEDDVKKVLYGV